MAGTINVEKVQARVRFIAQDAMLVATQEAYGRLRETAPVASSRMRDRFAYGVSTLGDRIVGTVQNDVPYGQYVIEGTAPHEIRAVNARALRFYWPVVGSIVYAKSVQHPGTAPNPFWQNVLDAWPNMLRRQI